MIDRISATELKQALRQIPGWSIAQSGQAIEKTFEFADFNQAFGFMARAAMAAEKADHHPEWHNVYSRVAVTLTTHEVGGVTTRDLELATAMERFATS